MFYLLPNEVRDGLVQYLSTRPVGEVFGLVQAIMTMQKVEASPAPKEKTDVE